MMISDGNGMHADSIPIKSAIPAYPPAEITAIMNLRQNSNYFFYHSVLV